MSRQQRLSIKDPAEIIFVTFDLVNILETGETISASTVTASVEAAAEGATDNTPSAIISGGASFAAPLVVQRVIGGVNGVDYELRCVSDTSTGRKLVVTATLPVRVR